MPGNLSFDFLGVDFSGVRKAEEEMYRLMRELEKAREDLPTLLGRGLAASLLDLWRYAASVTHVWTGNLRASHRVDMEEMQEDFVQGRLHLIPNRNPVHGLPATFYGPIEHWRGGSHAFYERTYRERGRHAALEFAKIVGRGIVERIGGEA